MTKTKIIGLLVGLTMSLFGLAVVQTTASPPASASIVGCKGSYTKRAEPWARNVAYPNADPIGLPGDVWRSIRIVGTTTYFYCPNGTSVDKVMPLNVSWCYTHIDDRGILFDGVKFDVLFGDVNDYIDPPQIKVPDNNKVQNCVGQNISPAVWFRIDQNAGWSVSAWVVVIGLPDQHYDLLWNGVGRRPFYPAQDAILDTYPG